MRSIDLIFVIGLGIAMGSILGKVWSVSPTGLVLYQVTGNAIFDAIASIAIGVILGATAIWLAYESKGLLIGEAAEPELTRAMRRLASSGEGVRHINELITLHMGPAQIIVVASLDFHSSVDAATVERTVTDLTRLIKALDSRVARVFIEAEDRADHNPGHQPVETV